MEQQQKSRPSRWQRVSRALLSISPLLLLVGVAVALIRFARLQRRAAPTYQAPAQLADADGAFIMVNGMQIYYRARGPVDGQAIILVHGFLLETATFEPLLEALAAQGYRVIAFDRPPFGLSDKAPDLDYRRQAHGDLLIGLMDQLGIKQAVLLGHSAGAMVTAGVALRYPERVAKLVMVDAAFLDFLNPPAMLKGDRPANPAGGPMMNLIANGLNPWPHWAELEIRAYFTAARVTTVGRANYGNPTLVPPARLARLSRLLQIAGWEGGLRAFGRQILTETPLRVADLAGLTVPTLIQWGEADIFIPPVTGERLAETIPNARLITYPGCGHIAWDGCDSSFVADLVAFLQ